MFLLLVATTTTAVRLISSTGFKILPKWDLVEAAQTLPESTQRIVMNKTTEISYTGKFVSGERYNIKDEGVYVCSVCSLPMFCSKHKFVSGTGWPSFYDVFDHDHLQKLISVDTPGYTEIACARDGAHLGHAYPDKPSPALKRSLESENIVFPPHCFVRYCVNAGALRFVPLSLVSTLR